MVADLIQDLLIILAAGVFMSFASDAFFTTGNLTAILLAVSTQGIVAIGMTFTILTAGIDLSVGSMMALGGALAAGLAVQQGWGTYGGIGAALLVGLALGGVNGLLIIRGGMPPFVATLAMMAVARGLTLVFTEGRPIAATKWSTTSPT